MDVLARTFDRNNSALVQFNQHRIIPNRPITTRPGGMCRQQRIGREGHGHLSQTQAISTQSHELSPLISPLDHITKGQHWHRSIGSLEDGFDDLFEDLSRRKWVGGVMYHHNL